jgi:hypothetical protein
VKRAAHHHDPNGGTAQHYAAKLGGIEIDHPRPEADVGILRRLRLHTHKVLDRFGGCRCVALEQPLTSQQRTVELAVG